MADTLSIEEMNRARAALGMPLLPVPNSSSNLEFKPSSSSKDQEDGDEEDPGSTLESRQAAASENWQKLQAEAEEKKKREERRAALKKERDAAQRFAKLEGKGLGEPMHDDIDTRTWLLSGQKRQKKIAKDRARMMQKELEERENQAQYTEKDLAGKRVGHELGRFEDGDQILTLKDATVDDEDEDDELENIEMREKEKLEDRLKLKTKKPVYDPNAEDEEGGRSILGQYDEEIDGKQRKRFTLDGQGRSTEDASHRGEGASKRQGMTFNLDFEDDQKPVSDYLDASEVKIKKPKKKKDKSKRRRAEDDDDIFPPVEAVAASVEDHNAMEIEAEVNEAANGSNKRRLEETSFVDDDDLQSNLALQRREALKKRKRGRPEDIARQVREEESATPTASNTMDTNDDGGLVIDETSEFVANLQKPQAREKRSNGVKRGPSASASPAADDDGDVNMAQAYDEVKDESDDEDEDVKSRVKRGTSSLPPGNDGDQTATGLADEETMGNAGIGSTLGMLTQRGLVKAAGGGDLNTVHSQQAEFLRHKERLEKEFDRKAQETRRRDRENGVFDRMSKRQQEEYAQNENKRRDQYVSRQLDELFNREYRPNVELKYIDEHGRYMDQREAFKQMSWQFHGKGSGKQKTEKRLKKIEDEKKREAVSSLDSSQRTGMDNAMGTMGKRKGQAGVRLQ